MNVKTFRIGGVHPEENKLTHDAVTQVAALPKQAIFPLGQHIGAPAKPVVCSCQGRQGQSWYNDCRGWWFCVGSYLFVSQWYRLQD